MEDRRTALAIFLIIVVVMVYSELFLAPHTRPRIPSRTPQQTSSETQPSAGQASPREVTAQTNFQAQTLKTPLVIHPASVEIEARPQVSVESDEFAADITLLGARLRSFKLKRYFQRVGDETPLDLVTALDGAPLPLAVYVGEQHDGYVNYNLVGHEAELIEKKGLKFTGPKKGDLTITFRGELHPGTTITKTMKFYPGSYLFDIDVKIEPPSPSAGLWLEWSRYVPPLFLEERLNPINFTLLTEAGKIKHIPLSGFGEELAPPLVWTGIADQYFTATLIPKAKGLNAHLLKGQEGVFLQRIKGDNAALSASLYVGPKDYRILNKLGYELSRSIDLGLFAFVAYPLLLLIRAFENLLGNYGLSIVAVTLLIKALFFPLTRASLKSMQAMQELQPEMKALRDRIKDPAQLNQEILALYKKRGVNPMGGCFPILIQIPVFFGLYSALLHSIELRHAPFALWIKDLSSPERLEFMGINFPVMILIMGATMFWQQYATPSPSLDPAQRKMMLIMPIIFTGMFLIFPFPAGLALYMLVNTAISLIQQAYLKSDKKANPFRATLLASAAIFGFAYVLTLLD